MGFGNRFGRYGIPKCFTRRSFIVFIFSFTSIKIPYVLKSASHINLTNNYLCKALKDNLNKYKDLNEHTND